MEPRTQHSIALWRRCSLFVLAALAVALLLLASLLSRPTAASTSSLPTPHSPTHLTLLADEEEGEEDEEEWESGVEEGEEDEEGNEAGGTGEGEPGEGDRPHSVPSECTEYTVAARVVTSVVHRTVRLTVHYETYEAGRARLSYWLKGARGSLELGKAHWTVKGHGELRRTSHLSPQQLAKARAARTYVVQLEMPDTPSHCEVYCTRHLTEHRSGAHGSTVWTEPSEEAKRPLRRPRG